MSKLTWDGFKFLIDDIEARDFLILKRKEKGMSINKLESLAGLDHPTLRRMERPDYGKGRSNSIRAILIALEALGMEIEIHEL